jgi:hypothetical protein
MQRARRKCSPTPGSTASALKLQDEGVYCAACGKYVSFVEVKQVLEHCFGSPGAQAEFAAKRRLKHDRGRSTRSSVVWPYIYFL